MNRENNACYFVNITCSNAKNMLSHNIVGYYWGSENRCSFLKYFQKGTKCIYALSNNIQKGQGLDLRMKTCGINLCMVLPVLQYFRCLIVFLPLKPFLKHLLCVWKVILWVECIECFYRIHLWELTLARYLT